MKMSEKMPELTEEERRMVISALEDQLRGDGSYDVMLINKAPRINALLKKIRGY